MILKRLEIHGYGPFLSPTTLEIDDNVTILTGQNDVGKSAALHLIRLLCGEVQPTEDNQNFDHKYSSGKFWKDDDSVSCTATFVVDEAFDTYFQSPNIHTGFEVDIGFNITKGQRAVVDIRQGNHRINVSDGFIKRMPFVFYLPIIGEIRSSFSFNNANSLEKQLLSLAFGLNPEEKFINLRPELRNRDIRKANEIIRDRLNRVLPYSMGLGLTLDWHNSPTDTVEFSVSFEDEHHGLTNLEQRGSGIKKIVALITFLVATADMTDHTFFLLDEPENSLHADAQHKLRGFLESIATNPKIQVIYATHSSSMINSLKPENVRLLKRIVSDTGNATTRIDNHPYRDNFLSVRTSLGISPSDSLLFGAVSIIIEGDTEALCLPFVFRILEEAKIQGFEKALFLLSLSHFISAKGTNIELWCRLAKEQRAKPIIFLDGDKRNDLKKWKFDEKHPDVPQILFPEKLEFENLVPLVHYIEALESIFKNESINLENYASWEETANIPENMMFTKRIMKWLKEVFNVEEKDYNKPASMKQAIELTPVEQIRTEELLKLLDNISNEMNKL